MSSKAVTNQLHGHDLLDDIICLYLDIKIRASDEVVHVTQESKAKEYQKLLTINPHIIIGYIRSTLEILLNNNIRPTHNIIEDTQPTEDYESMLQKLEAETREHIRLEQQLKLHIENQQSRVEELEIELKETNKTKQSIEIRLKEENEKLANEVKKKNGTYINSYNKII